MDDKVVFSVPWFDILARPVEGYAAPYYVLRTSDYVTVLAATTRGSLLLVRQYRPAVRTEMLELPSGHVENGEMPEAAARRELLEETGYQAHTFELLGTLAPDTGRLGNKLWCYYADHAVPSPSSITQEQGVRSVECDPHDLIRLVRNGEFNHGLHLAVLMLAAVRGRFPVVDV